MKSKMQKFDLKKNTNKKKRPHKNEFRKVQEKRKKKVVTDDSEIQELSTKLWPALGEKNEELPPSSIKAFTDLPISKKTLTGLSDHKFITPTEIQRESLLFALKGHDILGAAKTGSGKTLAFLIPVLELLFRQRYTPPFGPAALIMSPTRELAYQSFDTLKKIGKLHDISFGLITGGMDLKEEAKKVQYTNVIICTPGRFLQHLEQTPNFTTDEIKILVLDEADKILHMGFSDTMNAVISELPKQRQTLLFSATQTKSVKDLARLSLKRPVYVSVHEKAKETTPSTLEQRYIVCETQHKINTLWSFIMTHKHQKILAFMSCCKQVRYMFHVLKKMQPGLTVLSLHGHMKQNQRMIVYNTFINKQHAILLATDVAARGLDFPSINWVIQVDKPDSVDTYIHRVGRTARYEKAGHALMFLLASEEKQMIENLVKRKIPIKNIKVNKKQVFDVTKRLESLCASDQDIKDQAQKAFISVMKTLSILDKVAFKSVDQEAFAKSLGLVQAPRLPGTKVKQSLAEAEQSTDGEEDSDSESETGSDSESEEEKVEKSKPDKSMKFNFDSDEEEDNAFYNVQKDVQVTSQKDTDEVLPLIEEGVSRKKKTAREKLKLLKHAKRTVFDDETDKPVNDESDEEESKGLNLESAKRRLKEQDKLDRQAERMRIKEQHREKRLKEKEKRRQAEREKRGIEEESEVFLGREDGGDDQMDEEDTSEQEDDKHERVSGGSEDELSDDEEDDNEEDDDNSDDDAEEENDESEDGESEDEGPKRKKARIGNEKLTKATEEAALALLS